MTVIRMGDINVAEVETGLVIEATRDELRRLGHVLYQDVAIIPLAELKPRVGLSDADVVDSQAEKESGK